MFTLSCVVFFRRAPPEGTDRACGLQGGDGAALLFAAAAVSDPLQQTHRQSPAEET